MNPVKPARRSHSGLAEGIRTRGFRRWYERELLAGHAHLVLVLLSALGAMASLELMDSVSAAERLLDAFNVLVSAGIGIWALRRYLFLLMRAEQVANQANCPRCGTYGRLTVTGEDRRAGTTGVRCRRCGHDWVIEE